MKATSRRAPPASRAAIAAPAPKIAKEPDSSRSVKKNTGRGAAGKGKAAQEVGSTVSVARSSAVKKSKGKGKKILDLVEEAVQCTDDEVDAAEEEPAGFAEVPKSPSVSQHAAEADAPVEEAEEAAGGEAGDSDTLMSSVEAERSPSSEDQQRTAHTGGSSAAQPAAARAQPVVLGAMAPPSATAGLAGKWVGREEETARLMALLGAPGVAVPPILVTGHAATGKTLVVRGVLKELGLKHAYINAVETATPRQLFEEVLNQVRHPLFTIHFIHN